jgi:thioredoxin reductase (NADPH)
MSTPQLKQVVIIGSGPAGLTAAIYTARANFAPLVIEGTQPGGQLIITSEVENFPGFPDGITGPELMARMKQQAQKFQTEFWSGTITRVDFSGQPLKIFTETHEVHARAVIIATGASARTMGLPSEQRLVGRGVSMCATCDGFFFRNKNIMVVGGGDSALEEALFLTKFAAKVFIVHRRDALRGSRIMQERALKHPKIEFIWNAVITEVLGQDHVTGVRWQDVRTQAQTVQDIDGVFVAIGHTPNTGVFKGQIDLDPNGYIMTTREVHTSRPGVFAAGDVIDTKYKQAVTAAGSGCQAALACEKCLTEC